MSSGNVQSEIQAKPDSSPDDSGPYLKSVVCIGASAGGLESIESLLKNLESGHSAAFVIIQHLSPNISSSMEEILHRSTTMKIEMVVDGMRMLPDTVYLIPPGEEIRLNGDCFQTTPQDRDVLTRVVDVFFKSVASEFGSKSIGIILSGSGSDGAEGVRAISLAGGTCLAESIETAQFDGMPKASIATGHISQIISPSEISTWLLRHFTGKPYIPTIEDSRLGTKNLSGLELLFALLSSRHDVDFSQYKISTVARRIERRQKIKEKYTLVQYAQFVRENDEELDALYYDLLIGVTKFFRDVDAFEQMERCIDELVQELPSNETLRVWSAGCASGEEPYSLAMAINDAFLRHEKIPNFKIFATDIHNGSLTVASNGVFHSESMEFVSQQRRERYFDLEPDGRYRISSGLRRFLVFARHNIFGDPPFTKMQIVSCRNLLIYLKQSAQMHAISSMHFSLVENGLLFLGTSESLGVLSEEFRTIDANWKMFQKIRNLPSLIGTRLGDADLAIRRGPRRLVNILNSDRPESLSFTKLIDCYDLVLQQFIESGLILDEQRNILHVFGNANQYLMSKTGRFSGKISDFLSGETKVAVLSALIRASKTPGQKVILQDITFTTNEGEQSLDIEVCTLVSQRINSTVWFVKFLPPPEDRPISTEPKPQTISHSGGDIADLESELLYTKDSLNATIEELEASNEELQAANEELVAANEELQSTNEELQSVNEELYTVNLENNRKIDELQEITDDLEVLLGNAEVGTLFLDHEMKIRKFTKSIVEYFDLMPHDVGRSIENFSCNLRFDSLFDKLREVMLTENPCEMDSTNADNEPIHIKITVHKSGDNPNGAILNIIKRPVN